MEKSINQIKWQNPANKIKNQVWSKIIKFIWAALFASMISACDNDKKISTTEWIKIYSKLDSIYQTWWWRFSYDGMYWVNQEYINKDEDGNIRFVINRDLYEENPQDYGIFEDIPKDLDNINIDITVHPDGTISGNWDIDAKTIYWESDKY